MKVVNKKQTMEDLEVGDCFKWEGDLYIKVKLSTTMEDKNDFNAIDLAEGDAIMIYDDEEIIYVDAIVTY